jgi:signal recognition particle GTPase
MSETSIQPESKTLLSDQVANMTQTMQLQAAGFLNNQLGQLASIAVYLAKEIDIFHQLEYAIVAQQVTPELVDSVISQLQDLRRQAQQNADAALQKQQESSNAQ